MRKPRAFCEFPAGLASLSLYLHGGKYCRPPISRQGAKTGYCEVLAATLGLRSGQGAGAYVWAEADADVAALLRCYPDAAMLQRVAEIIRGWADEEPRALWERLRAERKARVGAEGVARYVQLAGSNRLIPGAFATDGRWVNAARDGGSHTDGGVSFGGADFATPPQVNADACHRLAEYAVVVASNRLIHVADDGTGELRNTGDGGTTFGGREFATAPGEVAARFEGMAYDVAAAAAAAARTMPQAQARGATDGDFLPRIAPSGVVRYAPDAPAPGMDALARSGGWPPVAVLPRIPAANVLAAMLGTPGDLDGVVVYMDPPYLNTTGYAHDLGRDEVVAFARDFDRLGAVVAISEAEVVIGDWHAVEITEGRKGQKRTFSRQQAEWLSMNREPAHRVATQAALFGGAA